MLQYLDFMAPLVCHKECSAMDGQAGPRHTLEQSPWPDAKGIYLFLSTLSSPPVQNKQQHLRWNGASQSWQCKIRAQVTGKKMGSLSNFQAGQGRGRGRDRTGWQEQPGLLLCCHSSGTKQPNPFSCQMCTMLLLMMLLLAICLAVCLDLFSLFKCGIEHFGVASGLRLGGVWTVGQSKSHCRRGKMLTRSIA